MRVTYSTERPTRDMGCVVYAFEGGETLESLIRRFKKKVEKMGILKDYKKKEYFLTKSQIRKIKRAESIRKSKKQSREKWGDD